MRTRGSTNCVAMKFGPSSRGPSPFRPALARKSFTNLAATRPGDVHLRERVGRELYIEPCALAPTPHAPQRSSGTETRRALSPQRKTGTTQACVAPASCGRTDEREPQQIEATSSRAHGPPCVAPASPLAPPDTPSNESALRRRVTGSRGTFSLLSSPLCSVLGSRRGGTWHHAE